MSNDIDDMIESDGKKVRNAYQDYKHGSGSNFTIPKVLEGVLWAFAAVCGLGMVIVLPWVGEDKLIPGMMWLVVGVGGLLGFSAFAVTIRFVRTHSAEIDRTVESKMER